VDGDPEVVMMCNCDDCQRRSGSAFQLGAFFDKAKVKSISGSSKSFSRTGGSGRGIELKFCPECGVSVYFHADVRPDMIGIHAGCFADPDFPAPNRAAWVKRKHRWVVLPEVDEAFDENSVKDGAVERFDSKPAPTHRRLRR
jgi:hypothetical protein